MKIRRFTSTRLIQAIMDICICCEHKCENPICVYIQKMPSAYIGFVCTYVYAIVCMIMRYDSLSLREYTMGVDMRISVHM